MSALVLGFQLLACAVLAGCACAAPRPAPARLDQTYLPPSNAATAGGANLAAPAPPPNSYLPPTRGAGGAGGGSGGSAGDYGGGSSLSGSSGGPGGPGGAAGPAAGGNAKPIAIIKMVNVNNGDGSYMYRYGQNTKSLACMLHTVKNVMSDQHFIYF